jgi:DNA-binding FadR family transcriptional regulator
MEDRRDAARVAEGSTDQVVAFVRDLIERGRVRPGDRLPAERDRASRIGISRPSVRTVTRSPRRRTS